MSGTKISALPSATTVTLADILPVVVLGTPNITKQATVATFVAVLNGATLAGPLGVTAPGTVSAEVVNFGQFAPVAGATGYSDQPGGVTRQWGTSITSTGGTVTVTFPKPFSSAAWSVVATPNGQLTLSTAMVTITGFPTATQFVLSAVDSRTGNQLLGTTFSWEAVGPT